MIKIPQINQYNYSVSQNKYNFGKVQYAKNTIADISTSNVNLAPAPLRAYSLAFLGRPKDVVTPETLFRKIQNQSQNISRGHVELMFNNISKTLEDRGIKAYEEDILLAMWTLTQFANMDGMKKLNEQISKRTNASYKLYSQGSPVSLANVLYYLSKSKGIFPYDENKQGTIFALDSLGLNVLENKAKEGSLEDINYSHMEFIYPIGWNEGINLFNQDKNYRDFELRSADVIQKAYEKGTYFPNALNEVLIEDVQARAKKLGICDVHFLSNPRDRFYIDFEDIKNNLNANIPTKSEIEAICRGIGEYCHKKYGKDETYWTNLAAKYLYNGLNYYSPKKITEKLKKIYKEIEKNIPDDKTMDDVYFLLPQTGRSFSYINYQFAQVNNIPPHKFIHGDTERAEADYRDKIFVYLDDISASGQTVLEELGGLNYCGLAYVEDEMRDKFFLTSGHTKNQYIIATLSATSSALSRTEEEIEKRIRLDGDGLRVKDVLIKADTVHEDEVIYSDEEDRDLSKIHALFTDVSHGSGGFYGLETRIIFPYMTPDSNAPILKFLSEKFLPNTAIKTRLEPPDRELHIKRLIKKKLKD